MLRVVLREKCYPDGLTKDDVRFLLDKIEADEVVPFEVEAKYHESAAYGFISAITLDCYTNTDINVMKSYIASILDDMDLETTDHRYQWGNTEIYLDR